MNGMFEAKYIQRSVSESAQIGVYTIPAIPRTVSLGSVTHTRIGDPFPATPKSVV